MTSQFYEGLAAGAAGALIVFVIAARIILRQIGKRGQAALEQLAQDTLQRMTKPPV